ncbi:MAG: gamma-glutamyltransferase [Pedosphaera sp.]|nr:gamma-glutamyltransferase [Pedosphaera sp.]
MFTCTPLAIVSFFIMSAFAMDAASLNRTQGRSMVISRGGIVASEHPLASQAGAAIFAQGGNAMDAAIAANAAMGFLSPGMNGIGGDLFAIVYDAKSGKVHGLNASGWSPKSLTPEFLKQRGIQTMPQGGIHSVTVPGCVDGWAELHGKFGKLKFAQVFTPAIRMAQQGVPVPELISGYWASAVGLLQQNENAARTFLNEGRAPRLGNVFKNPDLASVLETIAKKGRDGFYKGPVAARIVQFSKRLDGAMTLEDLGGYRAQWVQTITTDYRGWTVHEIPPNGQGIAALAMLNLMEQYPLTKLGHNSEESLHVMIEAKKLAYADMIAHVGDQRFAKVPVKQMLSKEYAKNRARLIDLEKASDVATPGKFEAGPDTTYLCTVDRDGNMVSLIQSNYYNFGSGLVPDGCGFPLQNRGALFSLEAGHPNCLSGNKRPLHTIIPGFMEKGDLRIAFGIMGGWNQSQAHAQFVSNIVDHGLNLQAAIESPRFTKMGFEGRDVAMERRIPQSIRELLVGKGHIVTELGDFSSSVGGGQAVMHDAKSGVNFGASDPRKDGAAIPEPPPVK